MTVQIRPASRGDLAAVVDAYDWLFAAPGSLPPEWEPDLAADRLANLTSSDDRGTLLVAVDDERIVGFCTVYLTFVSVRFGQASWVEDLAVDPHRRSSGIGRRLLAAAMAWAREHGASHLGLNSGVGRTDAHRFYEREQPTRRSLSFDWQL